jgi:ABC-2 type transport system ATP-binding protein
VLVSSHLLHEMAVTADHLLVIGRGRLIADCSTAEFIACNSQQRSVLVKTPDAAGLAALVAAQGAQVRQDGADALIVTGLEAPRLAELAAQEGLVLHELTPRVASLEEAFMQLTKDSLDYGRSTP